MAEEGYGTKRTITVNINGEYPKLAASPREGNLCFNNLIRRMVLMLIHQINNQDIWVNLGK